MKKKLYHTLLPIFMILVLNLVFIRPVQAVSHEQSNNNFTFSFSDASELSPCQDESYWLVNIGYNDLNTQVKGSVHPISQTSATDSFNITDGTLIQLVEIWMGDTPEG